MSKQELIVLQLYSNAFYFSHPKAVLPPVTLGRPSRAHQAGRISFGLESCRNQDFRVQKTAETAPFNSQDCPQNAKIHTSILTDRGLFQARLRQPLGVVQAGRAPLSYNNCPSAELQVLIADLRVPIADLRVPITDLRVAIAHCRVPSCIVNGELHCECRVALRVLSCDCRLPSCKFRVPMADGRVPIVELTI